MSLPRSFLLVESGAVVGSARLVDDLDGAPVFRAVVRATRCEQRPTPLRTPEQANAGLEFVARKGGRK